MIMSSRITTTRCPCRERGTGPVKEDTRLQFNSTGAAIITPSAPPSHNAPGPRGSPTGQQQRGRRGQSRHHGDASSK
ncbi:hypothetical protein FKM82_019167 [Ascaphus truei]